MAREKLISLMTELLCNTVREQGNDGVGNVSASSPLIGSDAILTSLALVSFITDVEALLAQTFDLEITLVSEQALSRKNSPFRSVEALAEYVLELESDSEGVKKVAAVSP